MENCLFLLILQAQSGDEDAMLQLLSKFNPLLKKHSFLLSKEDSLEELTVFFIALIKNNNWDSLKIKADGNVVNYLSNSVRHEYIRLSELNKRNQVIALADDENIFTYALKEEDVYNDLLHCDIQKILTPLELSVVIMHFTQDMSVVEIARKQHVTRQAVNQQKNNALNLNSA